MNAQLRRHPGARQLRINEPMAKHTTWRVGGPAERFFSPADADELSDFMAQLTADESLYWIGLGSNLLVRDGGLRGTVICTAQALSDCGFAEGTRIRAAAGVPCARIAKLSAEAGLTGAEFLIGIPGTLGGALAMNAGAFGSETWALVRRVETVNRQGVRRWRDRSDYSVGYREVQGPQDEWFLAAELELTPGNSVAGRAELKRLLQSRAASQPVGQPSCGSVFRNPPADYAARLIEQCGLKGLRLGGAEVSTKHANFILNTGTASAADIEDLIEAVRARVADRFGITLICEVKIVGERNLEAVHR